MKSRYSFAVLAIGVLSACAPALRHSAPTTPTPDELSPAPDRATTERMARTLGVRWNLPSVDLGEDEALVRSGPVAASWDIDVRSWEDHSRVEFYVSRFGGSQSRGFATWLERGSVYEPMIRTALREHGLPEDLYYLALVESGFEPHAYSSAAAVGVWQFMAPTAAGYGLQMDWWRDERRDPVASTFAAARFLRDLRTQFGSDFLAAAAYNGGPTRVRRGLDRRGNSVSGDNAFFALTEAGYLPRETQNYVPQLIAAALVAKEPDKYGISIERRPPLTYDSVMVEGGSSLLAVARAVGVESSEVLLLNPHYVRAATPPGSAEWEIRLPQGTELLFQERWSAMSRDDRRAYTVVRVSAGETLHDVARKQGITTRQLAAYNPDVRTTAGKLVEQNLRVPLPEIIAAMPSSPDPALERLVAAHTPALTYTVKSGDTLDGISRRHGVTVRQLQRWNDMEGRTLIRPGQRLRVAGP